MTKEIVTCNSIPSVILNDVEVQMNGIIRNSKGYLIGRLVNEVEFQGEHIKGLKPNKETNWKISDLVQRAVSLGNSKFSHAHLRQEMEDEIVKEAQSLLDLSLSEQQTRLIEAVERFIVPAETSRGQGGLPKYGEVKDWEIHLTKEGWEAIKSALKEGDN